jgi:hypothetical protein
MSSIKICFFFRDQRQIPSSKAVPPDYHTPGVYNHENREQVGECQKLDLEN